MTDQEITKWKMEIDQMTHTGLARLYRFAPSGHPVFDSSLPLYDYFKARFDSLGGMTSEVSKKIGWG